MSARAPSLGLHERELLLGCARVDLDPAAATRARALLREQLDWPALCFHARLHSVAPLLHRHLRELDAEGRVPAGARRTLLALAHATAYRNRIFAREHGQLVDAFHGRGIRVLVQKGLSLAELVYGGVALRPLIDLVYLVPAGDVDEARGVLLERGYRDDDVRPSQAVFRWACPQLILKRADPELRIAVVLQWNLVNWPRLHALDPEALWAEARAASVGGREVEVLSPRDLVLYLCVQADNHGYLNRAAVDRLPAADVLLATWSNNRLVRFVDIHEVVRRHRDELDWALVVERARAAGLEDAAYASLSLANELLGPTAPAETLEELRPARRPRLRRWLLEGIAATDGLGGGGPAPGQRVATAAWLRAPARRQIRLAQILGLAEVAFPRPETLRRLDGSGSGLPAGVAYGLHAGRTLGRSGASLARALAARARRQAEAGGA